MLVYILWNYQRNVYIVSAFNKSRRVRKQALLEFSIGNTKVDQIVLLSSQLLTDAILGIDFLISYEAEISFLGRSITLRINGEFYKIKFIGVMNAEKETNKVQGTPQQQHRNLRLTSILTQTTATKIADKLGHYPP